MILQPPPWEGRTGGLSAREIAEFLAAPWNGRLATVTPARTPYVAAVWYEYHPEGGTFDIVARERAAFVRHIRLDPHVAFHVADDLRLSHTRVMVQGVAEIREGPVAPSRSPSMRALIARMAAKYLGPDGVEYATRTDDRPRCLIRIFPQRVRTWSGREWHPRYFGAG